MRYEKTLVEDDSDATQAVKAEAGLGALRPFLEQLPWAVIAVDKLGQVVFVNQALRLRRGVGQSAWHGTLEALFPEYHAALRGVVPWLTPQEAEITRDAASGEVVHERIVVRRLPMGACLLIDDQTRLRELEAMDVQTARLASLGFMLAGACHEVSNPLAAVYSMVQILRQQDRQASPETFEKGLASIAANVKRLLDISRRLVGFSRVDDEPRMHFRVDESVDEALVVLRQSLDLEQVALERHGDPEAMMLGNPGQMQEVFYNILLNAIQAMEGRGRLLVRTQRRAPEQIEVAIHDDGPGIAPRFLERLFEPFFTTKPMGKGTGLGLSISNEIVQEHGGSIEVENDISRGAWFYVRLPALERQS